MTKKYIGCRFLYVLIAGLCLCYGFSSIEAKKVKNTLIVKKDKKTSGQIIESEGYEINIADSLASDSVVVSDTMTTLRKVSFAGYDKEPNSNLESFMIINPSSLTIIGFEVKVNYLDMQDRMLHSRIIKENCEVPPGETRRMDIKTWDKQHAYYYYLGNRPKRVATPFKVEFIPLSYLIK